jgi:hypothetical protein
MDPQEKRVGMASDGMASVFSELMFIAPICLQAYVPHIPTVSVAYLYVPAPLSEHRIAPPCRLADRELL